MSKLSHDALERFKELYPERFAELQAQAERDWDKPRTPRRGDTPTATAANPPKWFLEGKTFDQATEECMRENNLYLITTEDHRYCESGKTPEEAAEKLSRHNSYNGEPVINTELLRERPKDTNTYWIEDGKLYHSCYRGLRQSAPSHETIIHWKYYEDGYFRGMKRGHYSRFLDRTAGADFIKCKACGEEYNYHTTGPTTESE